MIDAREIAESEAGKTWLMLSSDSSKLFVQWIDWSNSFVKSLDESTLDDNEKRTVKICLVLAVGDFI